jgi:hypothetical protein
MFHILHIYLLDSEVLKIFVAALVIPLVVSVSSIKQASSESSWMFFTNSTENQADICNYVVNDDKLNSNLPNHIKKISKSNQLDSAMQLSSMDLYDDFSEGTYGLDKYEVSPNGKWFHWYSGSQLEPGNQGVKPSTTTLGNVFFLESPTALNQEQTYSSLTLSTRDYKNFHMNLDVRTVSQTREGSPPNPWEVAWIFWHAIGEGTEKMDRTHFYYFLFRTNGADVGKYDGGTNPESQIILANKNYPQETSLYNKIGEWYNWDIVVLNDHITIKINNNTTFDIRDNASFDSGRIGLYNENSKTEFRNVHIKPLC